MGRGEKGGGVKVSDLTCYFPGNSTAGGGGGGGAAAGDGGVEGEGLIRV